MYMPVSTKSHKNVWRPLAHALAAKGHQVTMVTMYEDKEWPENYSEIVVDYNVKEIFNSVAKEVANPKDQDIFRRLRFAYDIFHEASSVHKLVLDDPRISALVSDPNTRFDVTIVLPVMNEVGLYLANEFQSPTILFMSSVANSLLSASMGYHDNPTVATHSASLSGQDLPSFHERLALFVEFYFIGGIKRLLAKPQEKLWREYLLSRGKQPSPYDLWDLERNASFGMYFSHYIFDSIRPTLPNTVDVGFIQCQPPKPLPTQLARIANASGDAGVILISFGSWLSTDDLPNKIKQVLVDSMSLVPQQVVWKWRNTTKMTVSKNVHIANTWLPQQDLLGHPSTRLFITQGGMMSVQETLYHGVPVLIIPLFADQVANGQRAQRQGYGKVLPVEELTIATLLGNITELIDNSSYRLKAQQLRRIIMDDIDTPVEKALFWTEYVMRHRGAPHMRSPAHRLSFMHFHNVDILLTLAVIVIILFTLGTWVTWKISKKIISRIILK